MQRLSLDTPPPHPFGKSDPAPAARPGRRGAMLAMLTLIYALNYLDRQIVVILQEPIKHEYQLQDWQLGVLTGASISILYTAMGIPIARWVDRGANRVRLIATITAIWSLATALCGFTRTFGQFVTVRMGVGLAEAGFAPAAHSMLSDLYPLQRRPAAMGIFAIGISIGIMGGLSIGGFLAQRYDWRIALMAVSLPGLLIALIFRLVAGEPVRGASEEDPASAGAGKLPFVPAIRELARRPAYVHITVASAATSLALTGLYAWLPSFLIRVHGLTLAQAGMGLGLLLGVAGLVGTMAGGWLAARFASHGLHAMLWAPIGGMIASIPLLILALTAGNSTTTLWMLLLPLTLTGLWTAPGIALTQTLAPISARATASAVYIVSSNLFGVALGPILVGLISDHLARVTGDAGGALRWALIVAALLLSWGIVHWWMAMAALRRDAAVDDASGTGSSLA